MAPLLSAHLDGELDESEERLVRRHLSAGEGCARCADRLRTLGAAREAMRGARPEALGPDASGPDADRGLDSLLERIRRRRRIAGIAAGLAAAALLAVALLGPLLTPEVGNAPGTEAPAAGVPALPAAAADDGAPACLRPEECGADAPVLFPAVPI